MFAPQRLRKKDKSGLIRKTRNLRQRKSGLRRNGLRRTYVICAKMLWVKLARKHVRTWKIKGSRLCLIPWAPPASTRERFSEKLCVDFAQKKLLKPERRVLHASSLKHTLND